MSSSPSAGVCECVYTGVQWTSSHCGALRVNFNQLSAHLKSFWKRRWLPKGLCSRMCIKTSRTAFGDASLLAPVTAGVQQVLVWLRELLRSGVT